MTLVEVTDADGVRLVTRNRPDALNALNDVLWDATRDALVGAQADSFEQGRHTGPDIGRTQRLEIADGFSDDVGRAHARVQ